MNRLAWAMLACCLTATQADSRTLIVRSGEHPGFSRIAIVAGKQVNWSLEPVESGYVLSFGSEDLEFDLSKVFDLIPRDRIADLLQVPGKAALSFRVDCDCHATAFATEGGAIVVDVADGAPPFEITAVASAGKTRSVGSAETKGTAAPNNQGAAGRSLFAPESSYTAAIGADPHLELYWKDVERRDGLKSDVAAQAFSPAPHDSRIAETETLLLRQLSRAASQGLVSVDLTEIREPSPSPDPEADVTRMGEPSDPMTASVETHLNIEAQTSIDRDVLPKADSMPVTSEGGACLSADRIAVGDWGDDRPAAVQISEKRSALLGEFDIPSDQAVTDLAKLYIFLGFGAEAAGVLDAFGSRSPDAAILEELAAIMDEGQTRSDTKLGQMIDCDTPAALWGVLARARLSPGDTVDRAAVLRAFSSLPPHLRHALGTALASRFLEIGDEGVARTIRDAMNRAPGDPGAALALIEARIDLLHGDTDAADAALAKVLSINGPEQIEALVLLVQSRLDRDLPVGTDLAATAGALAFERREAVDGVRLLRAHVLAEASNGNLSEAFAALDNWSEAGSEDDMQLLVHDLFQILARDRNDAMFLRGYFAQRNRFDREVDDPSLRIAVAERLLASGFPKEAGETLASLALQDRPVRELRARSAMGQNQPEAALEFLEENTSPAAAMLRAEAAALTGNHASAAMGFEAAGDVDAAGRSAWLAGDWDAVDRNGANPLRQAVGTFGLLEQSSRGSPARDETSDGSEIVPAGPAGQLAQSRAALAKSQVVREMVGTLLSTPTPDARPGG